VLQDAVAERSRAGARRRTRGDVGDLSGSERKEEEQRRANKLSDGGDDWRVSVTRSGQSAIAVDTCRQCHR
jgi:hypothetical protein